GPFIRPGALVGPAAPGLLPDRPGVGCPAVPLRARLCVFYVPHVVYPRASASHSARGHLGQLGWGHGPERPRACGTRRARRSRAARVFSCPPGPFSGGGALRGLPASLPLRQIDRSGASHRRQWCSGLRGSNRSNGGSHRRKAEQRRELENLWQRGGRCSGGPLERACPSPFVLDFPCASPPRVRFLVGRPSGLFWLFLLGPPSRQPVWWGVACVRSLRRRAFQVVRPRAASVWPGRRAPVAPRVGRVALRWAHPSAARATWMESALAGACSDKTWLTGVVACIVSGA
ncbi:unnamed protein product, partial [Amoebophrya sp. A120]